ncbi:selenocysteine lyase, isoform CRA_d [Mus musculus]|nr:selenocysteine lyase, isoform CRA_d [Mus musculus]
MDAARNGALGSVESLPDSPIRPRYVVQATPAFSDMVELAYNPNTEDRRIVIWRPAWITQ